MQQVPVLLLMLLMILLLLLLLLLLLTEKPIEMWEPQTRKLQLERQLLRATPGH